MKYIYLSFLILFFSINIRADNTQEKNQVIAAIKAGNTDKVNTQLKACKKSKKKLAKVFKKDTEGQISPFVIQESKKKKDAAKETANSVFSLSRFKNASAGIICLGYGIYNLVSALDMQSEDDDTSKVSNIAASGGLMGSGVYFLYHAWNNTDAKFNYAKAQEIHQRVKVYYNKYKKLRAS